MKNYIKSASALKTRKGFFALCCGLPLLIATCRQTRLNNLDNTISDLEKKIYATQDYRHAPVPENLKNTQVRYRKTADSVDARFDMIDTCIANNEKLIEYAFNNYAARIGRNFQMSDFLSQKDIATFQKYVANLDTMDFVQEMARRRVLQNAGSLHDLSYFFELFDFDSINSELEKKLVWHFYGDTLNSHSNTKIYEICVLDFDDSVLNNALHNENKLLNMAWQDTYKNYFDDSTTLDSGAKTQPIIDSMANEYGVSDFEQFYGPNFSIPEFDSVRAQYMHNDSLINIYNKTVNGMLKAGDTLERYKQQLIRTRDSLIKVRKGLCK